MRGQKSPLLKMAIAVLFLSVFQSLQSQPVPVLSYSSIVSGFTAPVDIVAEPGSDRLFVVQQNGYIRIVDNGAITDTFLNVSGLITFNNDERGLLSLAFHPDYETNRYLFIYYNGTVSNRITIARYRRDDTNPDTVETGDPTSGIELLTINKSNTNHNGGKLNFGTDGMLYFGTGDGGGSNDVPNNAQNPTSLLGKMLRLDVDNFAVNTYQIPNDNPFSGADPGNIADEVFSLGLRNPWRWSFDRTSGDIWIADVGQGNWEEVNHLTQAQAAGANYGWRCREGLHPNPNIGACSPVGGTTRDPIFEYDHTLGRSITGGYVYRGTEPANAALSGYYVCADYISRNLWLVRPDGSSVRQAGLTQSITGFGEDNNGELYAVSSSGTLFSVVVSSVLPLKLVSFSGTSEAGYNDLKWITALEENTEKFVIEYSTDGSSFVVAGEVAARNGGSYSFRHAINNSGLLKYRLNMVDIDGSNHYSPIISIGNNNNKEIGIYPTVVSDNVLKIVSGQVIDKIEIYSLEGKQVHTRRMNAARGYFSIQLPTLQKGMYIIKLTGADFQKTERFIID
jgi:glucose/arabinose dehydrogenase